MGKRLIVSPDYEFGGPLGVALLILLLPSTVILLNLICSPVYCLNFDNASELLDQIRLSPNTSFFNFRDMGLVILWLGFQAFLAISIGGPLVEGTPIGLTKTRLLYKVNGHSCFWITVVGTLACLHFQILPFAYLHDHFLSMASSVILLSAVLSIFLYLVSFRKDQNVVLTGHAKVPSHVYKFFMGRELNPRIGIFDIKYFCELRPGLLGWIFLNFGMLLKQYESQGRVTPEMILINCFQGLYVWDALYHESSILTTIDITKDGFGFMLAFGDMCWVPFVYSLQARYLVHHEPNLSYWSLGGITLVNVAGYAIFRLSNSQKNAFRSSRDPKPEWRYITSKTESGYSRLLISGWWGLARKINYTGDWLISLAWCLLTGSQSFVPYFYTLYFAVLLVHRAMRDDRMCFQKYGADWIKYKALVPYVFVPYVI